jgi:hypothetical protein
MQMKRSTEERQELLKNLNAIDRIVVTVYRLLLGVVIAAVTAVVVLVIMRRPWGAGTQGEWFYFSVAVLFVMGWAIGQFAMLDRRQRRRNALSTFQAHASKTEDGARTWEFRFGPATSEGQQNPVASKKDIQLSFSRSLDVPLASLRAAVLPDNDALACLEAELNRGVHIDEACTLVEPAFADWNRFERDAYRQCVTNMLHQRSDASAE